MEIINGVVCKRIDGLKGKFMALEDAVKSYENLIRHLGLKCLRPVVIYSKIYPFKLDRLVWL